MEDLSSFNITWDDQTEISNLSSPLPQTRDVFWDEKTLGLPFQGHSSAPRLAPSSKLCIVQESSKREKESLLPESGALDSEDGTTDFQGLPQIQPPLPSKLLSLAFQRSSSCSQILLPLSWTPYLTLQPHEGPCQRRPPAASPLSPIFFLHNPFPWVRP